MKLYLVERTDMPHYDEYDSVLVRAAKPSDALEMVCVSEKFSGFKANGSNASVTLVTASGEPEVIIDSFNAG